jgi:hypothetical protein
MAGDRNGYVLKVNRKGLEFFFREIFALFSAAPGILL